MKTLPVVLLLSCLALVACKEKKPSAGASGTFTVNIMGEPTTLNPFTSTDGYASSVQGYVIEALLDRDIDTYEWKPALAEKWEVSEDKKAFTFTLREGVKWQDGKPLTVEDVKFSFDHVFENPGSAHIRPYYENIKSVEILDPRTVRFHVKDDYFLNFDVAATLGVVPKHFYADASRKKEHGRVLIGTGPYKFSQYEKGKRIVLEQDPNWWGRKDPSASKEWQFKRVVLRFITDENVTLESFKKGVLDFISLRPDSYMKQTDGPEWGSRLIKVKTRNKGPKGYTWVGWNLKHPVLADVKVRRALAMLYNRDEAMRKFEYELSDHADGPIYTTSDYHSPKLRPIGFDPAGAAALLREAGWKDTDADGILDKVLGGKKTPLRLTILEPYEGYMKYMTLYKEDARKAGVDLELKPIEWNSFVKLLDEGKFDAVRMAWGGGSVDPDLKQIWHSSSRNGGSNRIGYSNPEVDKLIDQARRIHDRSQRIPLIQRASELIAADAPYLFLFCGRESLYAHNSRIKKEKDTYQYGIGSHYWTLAE